MGERKRLFLLVLIMTTVSLVVAGITIYVLYGTAFEQQRERLVEAAQSQARLIEAIARFDAARAQTNPEFYPGGPTVATLSQIIDAFMQTAVQGWYSQVAEDGASAEEIKSLLRQLVVRVVAQLKEVRPAETCVASMIGSSRRGRLISLP